MALPDLNLDNVGAGLADECADQVLLDFDIDRIALGLEQSFDRCFGLGSRAQDIHNERNRKYEEEENAPIYGRGCDGISVSLNSKNKSAALRHWQACRGA